MKALETTGTIDERGQLRLDAPLPVTGPSRARVIILLADDSEPDEREWLRGAATNPHLTFFETLARIFIPLLTESHSIHER